MTSCHHCGCDIETAPKRGKPRSVPQNARFHALIKAAYHHWPERKDLFQPGSVEHLRKWLQAKAGHRNVSTVETVGMTLDQTLAAVAAAIKAAGEHHYVEAVGSKFYVITSKSIAFDELPHLAACALFDDVAEVIEAETGLKVDQIMPPVTARRTTTERHMVRQAT